MTGEHEPERVYVVCRDCGEAFDDLAVAHAHGKAGCEGGWGGGFDIVPEQEAI